ncbi:uncharacterized protein [Onthophagus taurus]|uniref:uncharacterized protein n=1 Tax=Onthophagus taurus TaxID=166361 RepID=UPI000C204310|nr:uncharacterized protein LOC111423845 [Onthophagus taurus]
MYFRYFAVVCFVFVNIVNRAAYADKEDASEEIMDDDFSSEIEQNSTVDMRPLDSHEAMNNRVYKPRLTPAGLTNNREKRSFEFLLGLVNNNSRLQVTDTEEDVDALTPVIRRSKITSNDIGASELLLELLVKIAAHPDQWEQVHNLLQKIDRDLKTSKKIFNQMQTLKVKQEKSKNNDEIKKKKQGFTTKQYYSESTLKLTTPIPETTTTNNLYQFETKSISTSTPPNPTRIKSDDDQWLYSRSDNFQDTSTTKYPWEIPSKSIKNEKYPRNFAYHRVTGNPSYHTNMDNNPKAYIAVSVIAPKQMEDRRPNDALLLENELRQLKPWTHNQNLKNMASLRSRWVIQSEDKNKSTYTT